MGVTFSERLVTRLAGLRIWRAPATRRGFLVTAALGGAALATDPWGYVTKPQSAYAAVCGPGAACNDGWSVMCCSINHGHNTCPPGSYPGGWWKADRSSYCGGAARYYIDCNAKPGTQHRCHCNTGSCDRRRVACNVFRYGQCNTQVHGVTAVVCRQISCRPPWEIYPGHCGRSSATDNNTAQHTAPCLTKANTFPARPTFAAAPSTLAARHSLRYPHRLTSADRHTTVVFTQTGNLVIHNNRGRVWTSGTSGKAPGGQAHLYASGEFAILNRRGVKVWSTHTGHPVGQAVVQLRNSGALVVVNHGRVVWSSHTHTP